MFHGCVSQHLGDCRPTIEAEHVKSLGGCGNFIFKCSPNEWRDVSFQLAGRTIAAQYSRRVPCSNSQQLVWASHPQLLRLLLRPQERCADIFPEHETQVFQMKQTSHVDPNQGVFSYRDAEEEVFSCVIAGCAAGEFQQCFHTR